MTRLLRAAGSISFFTLLSLLLGLFRDRLMAQALGAGWKQPEPPPRGHWQAPPETRREQLLQALERTQAPPRSTRRSRATRVLAFAAMAVCIYRGGAEAFRWAFFCMLAACVVDATDGSLARRLKVKEVLPNFDDYLI